MAQNGDITQSLPAGGTGEPGVYLPWVANGAEMDGMGPFYGSVTVQNLEDEARDLFFFPGIGENDAAYGHPHVVSNVQEHASVTVSASNLGVPSPGGSVRVHSFPVGTEYDSSDRTITASDEDSDIFLGRVTGMVKLASPTPTNAGQTTSANVTVDGYSGLTADQISDQYDEYVLPIVQTNNGWNTALRIASFGKESDPNSLVSFTVTFYEAGGQGIAGGASGSYSGTMAAGDVASLDLKHDLGFEDEWVGSAYITANTPIGAVADRYKPVTDMLLNTVSRPVEHGTEQQVAPLIFQNYNFWNSGISIANLEKHPVTVTVTYFTPGGSQVGTEHLTIPARGMEFIFTPGNQDLGFSGFVGAATITGTASNSSGSGRVIASIDQVKYYGNDDEVGDAMTYVTTGQFQNQATVGLGPEYSLPLVQKGNPNAGTGDTSGIQFFNASPSGSSSSVAEIWIDFFDSTGNRVAPTLTDSIYYQLRAHQGVTIYTHNLHEMPSGFQGSAYIDTNGGGRLSAVSNNVNYAVETDGAAAYNAVTISDQDRRTFDSYGELEQR